MIFTKKEPPKEIRMMKPLDLIKEYLEEGDRTDEHLRGPIPIMPDTYQPAPPMEGIFISRNGVPSFSVQNLTAGQAGIIQGSYAIGAQSGLIGNIFPH